jgi:hypothetical protein
MKKRAFARRKCGATLPLFMSPDNRKKAFFSGQIYGIARQACTGSGEAACPVFMSVKQR